MNDEQEPDLSFVPPHLHAEVRRRIEAIRAFLRKPGRAAAERYATDLGLSVTGFYFLVRAWRADPDPAKLPGAGRPSSKSGETSPEQLAVIAEAIAAMPGAPVEPVVRKALEIAAARRIRMLSVNTMRREVARLREGDLSPHPSILGADIAIVHTVADIPVNAVDGDAVLPLLTLAITTAEPVQIAGAALAVTGPDARATALVLADALGRIANAASGTLKTTISMDTYPGEDWATLHAILVRGGHEVVGRRLARPPIDTIATAAVGRKPAGIRLSPGLVRRPPLARTASQDRPALGMADAETYVRARLLGSGVTGPPAPPADREPPDPDLIRALLELSGRH